MMQQMTRQMTGGRMKKMAKMGRFGGKKGGFPF